MKLLRVLPVILIGLFFTLGAYAASATANMTGDNHFKFYISTNDAQQGILIGQSAGGVYDWLNPQHFTGTINPGNYFLHIEVLNDSGPGGFLGDFKAGNNYLVTDATNGWKTYDAWGGNLLASVNENRNNDPAGIWYQNSLAGTGKPNVGPVPGIDPNAYWIWTNVDGNGDQAAGLTRYFSSGITVTPEPISSTLFLLGGGAIAGLRLRRKNKSKV